MGINCAGPGPYGPPCDPVLCEDPTFLPGAPGRPEVVDTFPGAIAINWEAPNFSGNCDIIGYMVSFEDEITCEWNTVQIRDEVKPEPEKPRSRSASKDRELTPLAEEGDVMSEDKEAEMSKKAQERKKSTNV